MPRRHHSDSRRLSGSPISILGVSRCPHCVGCPRGGAHSLPAPPSLCSPLSIPHLVGGECYGTAEGTQDPEAKDSEAGSPQSCDLDKW